MTNVEISFKSAKSHSDLSYLYSVVAEAAEPGTFGIRIVDCNADEIHRLRTTKVPQNSISNAECRHGANCKLFD